MFQEFPKALYRGKTESILARDADHETELFAEGWRVEVVAEVVAESNEAPVEAPRRGRPRKVDPEAA